jgi:hypothetical protein
MPLKRVETASAGHVPEFDRPIPTRAGQLDAIRRKGQPQHPVLMSTELLHAGCWLCSPQFPYLNTSIKAATDQVCTVGGKGQTFDDVSMPSCPKQRATLYIPQFDRPIPASRGQQPFVRAESQGSLHCVGMRLPGPMQGVTPLAPNPNFSPRAGRRPKRSPGADGHRPDSMKDLGKDGVAKCGLRKCCILHLDALQKGAISPPKRSVRASATIFRASGLPAYSWTRCSRSCMVPTTSLSWKSCSQASCSSPARHKLGRSLPAGEQQATLVRRLSHPAQQHGVVFVAHTKAALGIVRLQQRFQVVEYEQIALRLEALQQ